MSKFTICAPLAKGCSARYARCAKNSRPPRLEESCAWLTCQRSSGARSGPSTARTSTPCACELRRPSPSTPLSPQAAASDALRSMCRCAAREHPRPPLDSGQSACARRPRMPRAMSAARDMQRRWAVKTTRSPHPKPRVHPLPSPFRM